MSDQIVTPPAEPPVPPTEPKPAEKKLLDDLKRAQAKAKELETKLAEALPYVEKFKGHEDAKALEVQRAAEARAKQESESQKREAAGRAIRDEVMYGLTSSGRKIDRKGVALILAGALSSESGITLGEDGTVSGIEAYLESVFSTFGPGPSDAAPRKPAPGLPDTKKDAGGVDPKFAGAQSFPLLVAMGPAAVTEYAEKYPERYAALKLAHNQASAYPVRVISPTALRSA